MPDYIRADIKITEFDIEDVITTSGVSPTPGPTPEDPFDPGPRGEDYTIWY